ncbi:fungal-specific transcription factor domain-containing protein [Crassisporium funariophilum]|nr:fungal-specific transcription factor domain-containing protein [Crassisporium funariophilum]
MAYRSHTASPCGSLSQSSSPSSSTNVSPYINTTPLDNMVPTDDQDSSSTHGTPNRSTTSLPRTQNAGKGGCWTCRVRRKKCDEQREGDSCKTCKRLTIRCLGWGPKRPDWMRDKKNVDNYKASIKAQLSRAGLIRGQPRHNPMQVPSHRGLPLPRQTSNRNGISVNQNRSEFEPFRQTIDAPYSQNHNGHLLPGMPGASNSSFDQISNFNDVYDHATGFPYPQSLSSASSSYHAPLQDPLNDQGFSLFQTSSTSEHLGFLDPSSVVSPYHAPSGQSAVHEELVMHYFTNVRKVQFFFAGDALTDITYTAVLEEPRGAVTLAICALADLHSKQMRVSQGLEAPNQNSENSSTTYLRQEALFKLESNKNTHGGWTDNDAIAALHLVSLSQLSGGGSDWDTPFNILRQWLLQLNLHLAENPWLAFLSLSPSVQLTVKVTLWLDVFASLSLLQPPKFLPLWQHMLGDQNNYWVSGNDLEMPHRMRMDTLTGCPDEAMLAIAEVSALAHWKASQIRNNCLSYPELIRRGTVIQQQLRRYQTDQSVINDTSSSRLHGSGDMLQPTEEERSLVGSIFRETAYLFLHTVLSNSTPGVPEIHDSVDAIVRLFTQLPPSDIDRALVFPICLAGCMTNDSTCRDFLKNRIRGLNESYGNLLQTRRLMEAVWQKRDVGGKEVDVRETIREQGLNLLLI